MDFDEMEMCLSRMKFLTLVMEDILLAASMAHPSDNNLSKALAVCSGMEALADNILITM